MYFSLTLVNHLAFTLLNISPIFLPLLTISLALFFLPADSFSLTHWSSLSLFLSLTYTSYFYFFLTLSSYLFYAHTSHPFHFCWPPFPFVDLSCWPLYSHWPILFFSLSYSCEPSPFLFFLHLPAIFFSLLLAQSAGAVEYFDCFSAEG